MYVLNLVFDLRDTNGRFSKDDQNVTPANLGKSLNWLDLVLNGRPEPVDPHLTAFNPEVESWIDLLQAETLLIPNKWDPTDPKKEDPDWICIRAVQHTQGQPDKAQDVKCVVSFGRPVRAHQKQASPFTHDDKNNGRAVTTFVGPGEKTSTGWWFPLKRIAIRPKTNKKLTHRYEFSVGLIVKTAAGDEYHYGEDPEMDIEM